MSIRTKTLKPSLFCTLLLALASSALAPAQAVPVAASLLVSSDTPNNRQERREDRQDDRGDRNDNRQGCRDDEGAMGKDKRDCKQEERHDNEVEPADSQ